MKFESKAGGLFGAYRIWAPSYATAIVLAFHGHGSRVDHWENNANGRAVRDALVAAGFVFVGAGSRLNSKTWGADQSLRVYRSALRWVRSQYPDLPVVVYANSMGCIEALNAIALGFVETPVALVGTSPTASLRAAFSARHGMFRRAIRIAYRFITDRGYESATRGHDPMLADPACFSGIPMLLFPAGDDTIIPPSEHAMALADRIGPSVQIVPGITGGHSFAFGRFTDRIVSHYVDHLP